MLAIIPVIVMVASNACQDGVTLDQLPHTLVNALLNVFVCIIVASKECNVCIIQQ